MSGFGVAGVRSSEGTLDRRAAGRDLWPLGTLDLWQGRAAPMPDGVYWPESDQQVLDVLRAAAAAGRPVVPYGAGSGVCGGARGRVGSWVLDVKALQDIGAIDEDRWTVDVGAGCNGQQLEDALNRNGFTLGHSPSSIWCSTVGGWAAARSAGQFSSKYGVFEDMVLGLTAVAPGRGVFRVGQDGDAPASWLPLLLGSEGTLAVITRLKLRIWPLPATRWLRGYRFSDVGSATDAMRRLMQAELWPSVVRLYDPVDTRIGGKTRPKDHAAGAQAKRFYRRWLERVDALDPVRHRSLALPLALPGLVNKVFDRIASGCLLVVGWEGPAQLVETLSAAGQRILGERGEDLGAGPGERWFAARHAVSYKLMPIFERGGFADTMEVATTWSNLEPLYHGVRAALSKTTVAMAHMSHAYPEGGCIYFSFAGRGDPEVYQRTWDAALEAVLAHGGTVTHHHGVGELKAAAVSQEVGPAVAGWRALKAELDPAGVLNPGRLFVEVDPREPPPPGEQPTDGLGRGPIREAPGPGALWPWESLPGLPRPQRLPWQTDWIEVRGRVAGAACALGRAPRSASGPDLREWLATEDPDATCTWATTTTTERWMGEGRPKKPWSVARELLKADLRPAVLTVIGGTLRVGFRGPAAAALGALASQRVAGGLTEVTWQATPLPAGPLEPCESGARDIVWVTPQGMYRRAR